MVDYLSYVDRLPNEYQVWRAGQISVSQSKCRNKKSDQTVRYGIELNSAVEGTEQLMQRDKGNNQFF